MQPQRLPRATRRTLTTALLLATLIAPILTSCQRTQPPTPPIDTTYAAGDHLQYRPGVSGQRETITLPDPDGEPSTLTYEVIDGLAIVGGDMIIATAAELAELAAAAHDTTVSPASAAIVQRMCSVPNFAICDIRFRWPDGTMPYTFANDWGFSETGVDFNAVMRARIREAMDLIEAVTAVRFVPRTHQRDYVEFTRGKGGCSAHVGRWGERQHVYLAYGCGLSATIHEILHALGMWHEHQRHDRNEHVVINWHNIDPDWWHAYEHHHLSFDIGPYDYDSIMHYGSGCKFDAKTKLCVEPAIVTIPPGIPIGVRNELSIGDIQGVYHLYPAPPTITITRPASGASYGRGASNIRFEAHVNDPAGKGATVDWFSHLDGLLGAGHTLDVFSGHLSYGPHIITARARDPQGNTATDVIVIEIRNDPPRVEILEPQPGSTYCNAEPIRFRARVIDHNEPTGTIPDERITWRSGPEGAFATGPTATRAFHPTGPHHITVRASDEQGLATEASVIIHTRDCTNQAPTVTITQPPTDTSYWADTFDPERQRWYKTITLAGHATDPEDGDLTGPALVWTTDQTTTQNPHLGTGNHLTIRLYAGTSTTHHTITLTATDSTGNQRTTLIRITIDIIS